MNDRPDPLTDMLAFLTKPAWFTAVFWLLPIASGAIAANAWRRDPAQRSGRHLGIWLLRLTMGAMWWQQSLWKIPPNYDGLIYWMTELSKHAAIPLHGDLVGSFLIPNITVFGPFVYLMEVAIGVSLILGLFSRLGAAVGCAMGINLWLGLYSAPGEWPWTYGYLIILQAFFVIDPPGRSLGADTLTAVRKRPWLGRTI